MKRQSSFFTLIEMLIVMAIIALLAGILLPALSSAREQTRRKTCGNNLSQIGKACIAYQEPNGDFFPAFAQSTSPMSTAIPSSGQGADGTFQPMPSLACLYPTYCPEAKVFGCPSTTDVPKIAFRYYYYNPATSSYSNTASSSTTYAVLHTCFGFDPYYNPSLNADTATVINSSSSDPAAYTGNEVGGINKCSYLYDELCNPRDLGPDQAMAADADGQTWLLPGNSHPPYASGWSRTPQKPNHRDGQNVMYLDGHVKWTDTVYYSHDPTDNIFCPQVNWNADVDSYLWDGTLADSRAAGQ